MSIDAARAFNRTCPPGTVVEVALRNGTTRTGKTKGAAIVWAGYALVEVEGWPSYWTVQALQERRAGPLEQADMNPQEAMAVLTMTTK